MDRIAPAGWHSVTPRLVVEDPAGLIAFLRMVFGATAVVVGDAPAQVRIGDSLIMVSRSGPRDVFPAFLYVYVDDVDGAFSRALAAGAALLEAVWDTPYGDRRGMVKDPFGNVWQLATPLPDGAKTVGA